MTPAAPAGEADDLLSQLIHAVRSHERSPDSYTRAEITECCDAVSRSLARLSECERDACAGLRKQLEKCHSAWCYMDRVIPVQGYEDNAARTRALVDAYLSLAARVGEDTRRLDGLEAAVKTGACPGIINDDAGRWAVTDDGMQNVPDNNQPIDIQTAFFVEAGKWRESIREAIDDYLRDDEDATTSPQTREGE